MGGFFGIPAAKGFNTMFEDIDGNPVKRNRYEYPYSYDLHVIWRGGTNEEINGDVYSDRLYGWDAKKHDSLCLKHFGDRGQLWGDRDQEKVQEFLREYLERPNLKLIVIMEGANQANGYPYWRFSYNKGE